MKAFVCHVYLYHFREREGERVRERGCRVGRETNGDLFGM